MSAEFDIFGGFVDQKALDAFKQLEAQAQKTAESMKQIALQKDAIFGNANNGSSNSMSKTQEKLAADLARANARIEEQKIKHDQRILELEKKLNDQIIIENQRRQNRIDEIDRKSQNSRTEAQQRAAQRAIELANRQAQAQQNAANRNANNSPQNRIDNSAQMTILKLQATLASQYTTQLQKLDAQIKLNIIETQKYVTANDTQNQDYLDLIGSTKRLSAEYDRLAKASGATMQKTSSMYGATYSLTQVMRELPNFAIDARIGFMSLSNNLPMLVDDFSRLAKEIDDVTGKEKGFSGALKEFGKSLLSINTIVIVASTLLVLYGEDIMDFIVNLKSAETAADRFYKTVKEGYDGIYKRMADDVSKITQFALDYYSARRKGDKEAIKSLEERGIKEYGLHQEQLDMIADNVNNWRKAFDIYLQMAKITYDNEFRLKAGAEQEWVIKRERANQKLIEQRVREAAIQSGSDAEGAESEVKRLREGRMGKMELTYWKETKDWTESIKAEKKAIEELKVLKQISVTAISPRLDPDKKNPKGKEMQDGSDFDIKRKFYDEELVAMRTRAAELEAQIDNKLTDNTVVFYTERKNAIQELFDLKQKLQLHEQSLEEEAVIEEDKNEKKKLQEKKANNEQLYKEGKLSKDRLLELNKQYEEALVILDENTTASLFDVADKYIVQTEKDAQKSVELILKYFDQVQGAMPTPAGGMKTPTVGVNIKGGGVAPASPTKITDRGGKSVGGVDPNSLEDMLNKEAYLYEIGLSTYKNYTKKKNEILEAANLQNKDFSEETNQRITDIEFDRGQTQIEIAQMTVDAISQIWDVFYQMQEDKIDAQLEKQTKVNEERVKQYEDEADAGMHSVKEVSDFKDNMAVYQASQEEEAARKKAELEKNAFLTSQAFAIAQIWLEYAKAQQAIIFNAQSFSLGAPAYLATASALNLTSAIAGTAIALAQTIPAFEKGGDVENDTIAKVSEQRQEYGVTKEGKVFLTPKKPSFMYLEKGTTIYPDVNKMDLDHFNALQGSLPMVAQDDRLLDEIKQLNRTMSRQKTPQINGMRLMQQMQYAEKSLSNRRGILN